jgi:hypothetical protein
VHQADEILLPLGLLSSSHIPSRVQVGDGFEDEDDDASAAIVDPGSSKQGIGRASQDFTPALRGTASVQT